jgi:hypothetical protein
MPRALAKADEADVERRCCSPAKYEPSRLDAANVRETVLAVGLHKRLYAAAEESGIGEQPPHIRMAAHPGDSGAELLGRRRAGHERRLDRAPAFVALRSVRSWPRTPGGRFKDKDPTVSGEALRANWIDGAQVVYIGKANKLWRRLSDVRKPSDELLAQPDVGIRFVVEGRGLLVADARVEPLRLDQVPAGVEAHFAHAEIPRVDLDCVHQPRAEPGLARGADDEEPRDLPDAAGEKAKPCAAEHFAVVARDKE